MLLTMIILVYLPVALTQAGYPPSLQDSGKHIALLKKPKSNRLFVFATQTDQNCPFFF
jgi:hypothetical protein